MTADGIASLVAVKDNFVLTSTGEEIDVVL